MRTANKQYDDTVNSVSAIFALEHTDLKQWRLMGSKSGEIVPGKGSKSGS